MVPPASMTRLTIEALTVEIGYAPLPETNSGNVPQVIGRPATEILSLKATVRSASAPEVGVASEATAYAHCQPQSKRIDKNFNPYLVTPGIEKVFFSA